MNIHSLAFYIAAPHFFVKYYFLDCVSKGRVSPVTARLKCPYEEGEDINESEAVTVVSGDGIGGG
jgi:cytochrome c-type biogenesis protein CcmH/NrfF